MSCAMGLVALGVGYLVLLQANREKEGLKLLGQAIGILIMIGAVASSLCAVKGKCHDGYSKSGKAPMCPFSGKHQAEEAPSA